MVKKNMWSWGEDTRLRDLFFTLSRKEIFFLVTIVVLDVRGSLGQYSEFMWGAVCGIFFLTRFNVLRAGFYLPKTSIRAICNVDAKVWFMVFAALCLYAGMLLLYPKALPELLKSARNIAKITGFLSVAYAFYGVILEEFMFRFIAYYSLERVAGRIIAFLGSVFLFAISHQYNLYYPIAVIPAGMFLAILTILTGSIVPSILLHSILNILIYLLVIYIV